MLKRLGWFYRTTPVPVICRPVLAVAEKAVNSLEATIDQSNDR